MRIRNSLTRYNGHSRSWRHVVRPIDRTEIISRIPFPVLGHSAGDWHRAGNTYQAGGTGGNPDELASNLGIQRKLHLAGVGEPVDIRLERATVSLFHLDSLPSGSRSRRLIRGFVRGIKTKKNKRGKEQPLSTCLRKLMNSWAREGNRGRDHFQSASPRGKRARNGKEPVGGPVDLLIGSLDGFYITLCSN